METPFEIIKSLLVNRDFVIALCGAITGGLFTLIGAARAHKLDRLHVQDQQNERLENVLRIIQTEANTLWHIFKSEYATELVQQGKTKPYLVEFPIGDGTFTIYDSAPEVLAYASSDTAQLIVFFYIRAKGLAELIKYNNEDVDKALGFAREAVAAHISTCRKLSIDPNPDELEQIYHGKIDQISDLMNMSATAETLINLYYEVESTHTLLNQHIDRDLKSLKENRLSKINKILLAVGNKNKIN